MMKRSALIASMLLLSACGNVSIYRDQQRTEETGVEFHLPKPYLMVVHGKDKTDASIVYLPDKSEKRYAFMRAGYGSSQLSISLNNGMLTSIGQNTDPKIPETLTAIGSLATSLATVRAADSGEKSSSTSVESVDLYEIEVVEGKITLRKVTESKE